MFNSLRIDATVRCRIDILKLILNSTRKKINLRYLASKYREPIPRSSFTFLIHWQELKKYVSFEYSKPYTLIIHEKKDVDKRVRYHLYRELEIETYSQSLGISFPEKYRHFLDLIDHNLTFGVEYEVVSLNNTEHEYDCMCENSFGVNIENIAPDTRCHGSSKRWSIQHDISVRPLDDEGFGFEYGSPVLQGIPGVLMLYKFCEWVKSRNYTVNRSCGMHVHIGNFFQGLPFQNRAKNLVKNILLSYKHNEKLIDCYVSRSRRERNNARYCDSIIGRSLTDLTLGKYFKISFRRFQQNGTFENRQHQGTLSFEKTISWVILNQAIARYASRKDRYLNARSLTDLLNKGLFNLKQSSINLLLNYFRGRFSRLNSRELLDFSPDPRLAEFNHSVARVSDNLYISSDGRRFDNYQNAEIYLRRSY